MLSDKDIETARRAGEILIDPFSQESLTPVGYDLRVGDYAFSWGKKKRIQIHKSPDQKLVIDPGDCVIISTLEKIRLAPTIAGTVHSMVSLVNMGLSHVSTTVDPGWPGPAFLDGGHFLVRVHNTRKARLTLRRGQRFCTICFFRTDTPATEKAHPHAPESQNPYEWLRIVRDQAIGLEKRPFWSYAWFWLLIVAAGILASSLFLFQPQDVGDWIQLVAVLALFVIAAVQQVGQPPLWRA